MYITPSGIYFANGKTHSCIYDLETNMLYRITNEAFNTVIKAINGDCCNKDENSFISSLCELGVLEESNIPGTLHYIDEILTASRAFNFAWIELTNQCNLRCIHCYNEHADIPKQQLTLDDFKHIVDQLESIGIKKVQLIGGEPFVIKDDLLFDMLSYITQKIDTIELFINGTMNTEDHLKKIKHDYPNVSFATSLHSYIESEHEKVTQVKGSYQKTLDNIRRMKDLGLKFRYVGTIMNGIEVGEPLDFGMPSRRDFIRLSGRGNIRLYNPEMLKRRAIIPENFSIKDIKGRLMYVYGESCYATHLYIGSDMNVYPCPMERRVSHGNLRGQSLRNILKNEILNISKDEIDECKHCEYRHLCLDCRPDTMSDNYYAKPWYCTYSPLTGTWTPLDEFVEYILALPAENKSSKFNCHC